jgi:hypothetical protein
LFDLNDLLESAEFYESVDGMSFVEEFPLPMRTPAHLISPPHPRITHQAGRPMNPENRSRRMRYIATSA